MDGDDAAGERSGNLIPALAITEAQQLRRWSAGSRNRAGNVVAVIPAGGLTLEIATADVVTGNAALGTAGTLEGANVLTFTISGASLFVGTGGELNVGRTGINDEAVDGTRRPAVGFSVSGARFAMASVTLGTESFTGLEGRA